MTVAAEQVSCARVLRLSPAELALLRRLPRPEHVVEDVVWCELETGHSGPHHGLGQISDDFWWWLRWDDREGRRELVEIGGCGAAGLDVDNGADVECSLPLGHHGRHSFLLGPD